MQPVKIPEPTRAAADNIAKLDRALKLFADAKERRETAQKAVTAAKFDLGDLTRNAPRVGSDIKAQAQHEKAVEDAQAAVKEATKTFIDLDGEVSQAAVAVNELRNAVSHSTQLELEPVQRAAQKQFETALDALLAAIEVCTAVNRVLGTGQSYLWPRIPSPLDGSDVAYNRPRAEPAVPSGWLRCRQLSSAAESVWPELPPAQAAE